MNLVLQWHGPFSVVDGGASPYLFGGEADPAVVGRPGVYLWTINVGEEEFVFYVGKTDVNFTHRLWTELRSRRKRAWDWVADPQERRSRIARPDCWDWIPDPKKLEFGVKKWLYEPSGWKKPNLSLWTEQEARFRACWEQFLQTLRVFIAPMAGSRKEVKDTETALMWAVWDQEEFIRRTDTDYFFLTNGDPWPSRLKFPFCIRSTAPVRFRGIGEVISGGCDSP